MASMGDMQRMVSPFQDVPNTRSMSNLRAMSNTSPALGGAQTPRASTMLGYTGGARTPIGAHEAAHQSTMSFDFQRGPTCRTMA